MGPKYNDNVATGREELGSTISYWRSKRHSKRAKVPNLAQAAKSEPFAPARGGEGHPFLQYMPKGFPWDPNTMLQCCNRQRRIDMHQNILEEQTPSEEGRSATTVKLKSALNLVLFFSVVHVGRIRPRSTSVLCIGRIRPRSIQDLSHLIMKSPLAPLFFESGTHVSYSKMKTFMESLNY